MVPVCYKNNQTHIEIVPVCYKNNQTHIDIVSVCYKNSQTYIEMVPVCYKNNQTCIQMLPFHYKNNYNSSPPKSRFLDYVFYCGFVLQVKIVFVCYLLQNICKSPLM